MPYTITIMSPAKLNLHLQIIGRHPTLSRYHELRSIMTKISLYDQLQLTIAKTGIPQYTLKGFSIEKERDILYKAYQYFIDRTNICFSLEIILHKTIPQQAGLGGGSSNAGCLLYELNRFFGFPIPVEVLVEESKVLGADVPFFVSRANTTVIEGIGESITPIQSHQMKFLLIKPSEDMATPYAFQTLAATMQMPNPHVLSKFDLQHAWDTNDISQMNRVFSNDFTSILPLAHSKTHHLLESLRKDPEIIWCGMSGSGTTLFALFQHDHTYESEKARYQSMGYFCAIVETLTN
ncbi:4-(cytidine 5'-diphospho)-2-C-methyl-D-erythritol kinase [Entomospira entomophila]|uniref:4-diphosphocytidyl-2-C-methyl-D-erythritol kinase n=1 Tax=Entomospira entomophila TaxID=2719988 RepID=A0A968KRX6_9SPIO|nr:4-(cytidine 5'-diphospho)-2-C-methyl-D-erythritol kinase [Entomospira entomophilus]NIZ41218.1 4-(cytidine 5'-diphospho)-2-C-methyl-D-erythritol kinase [Entomospira entomophilus]WDI35424.1 4-(cytidine 5'-diphospho)-2-C-methyl-D-erythritol kinase [Entomospira entomophilus]